MTALHIVWEHSEACNYTQREVSAGAIPMPLRSLIVPLTSGTILELCKMVPLTLGTMVPHRKNEVDEFYRFKVNDFASSNEVVRQYSPSRRKMRDKNNELFVKMKQIFHVQGQTKPQG